MWYLVEALVLIPAVGYACFKYGKYAAAKIASEASALKQVAADSKKLV